MGLFSTTYLVEGRREAQLVPYEKTVIEKKAPTDESIKYFEEIKEKAYSSILDKMEKHDNFVNLKAVIYEDFNERIKYCLYSVFLNGKEVKGRIKVKEEIEHMNIMGHIYKDLSRHIAGELIRLLGAKGLING